MRGKGTQFSVVCRNRPPESMRATFGPKAASVYMPAGTPSKSFTLSNWFNAHFSRL